MEVWKIVIGLIILSILTIICIFIYRNEVWLTDFRVICDARDQKTFNAIIDVMAEQTDILEAVYRDRENVVILDMRCRKWKKEKLTSLFKKIENAEVQ